MCCYLFPFLDVFCVLFCCYWSWKNYNNTSFKQYVTCLLYMYIGMRAFPPRMPMLFTSRMRMLLGLNSFVQFWHPILNRLTWNWEGGFVSQTIYPHLPVPYIFGTKIYCQLGAWFQIYRELEDERHMYIYTRNTYTYKSLILGGVKDHMQLRQLWIKLS